MNVLVTGGAGYVGSIVTEELLKQGHTPVVVDNLQQGHRSAVLPGADFLQADCGNTKDLTDIFGRYQINAVVHLAADSIVELSMTDPQKFFRNNVIGGINLLNTMLNYGIKKFIFSSSAAIYGEPQKVPIEEDHPQSPVNSYGETKLIFEKVLKWYGKAYGIQHISFRYFNAAGASERLGEDHHPETHLIPNILKAALNNRCSLSVFGTDYPTRDGTCIRDYVHVLDIAQAHVLALAKLDSFSGRAYNLGSGQGNSVLEVLQSVKNITGREIQVNYSPRRSGDPAILLASSDRARSELGWNPRFTDINLIVESAWKWVSQHPEGYGNPIK